MSLKILFLADANSSHTRKLANGFAKLGYTIGIFSLSQRTNDGSHWEKNVTVFDDDAFPAGMFSSSGLKKTAYFSKRKAVRKTIGYFRPDIVHAHYATSYGMLGWLSKFHPLIISAWGSDVLDFPKGFLKRALLKRILSAADELLVTSRTLQDSVKAMGLASAITPFGVDAELFKPGERKKSFDNGGLVFGIVKSLESVYNIDVAISAFAQFRSANPDSRLLIVGGGTHEGELKKLVQLLGVADYVKFTGKVPHDEVPEWHNAYDVFLNLSQYESFGVSVLEAMACSKPVIVTDTGGLAEIVENNVDGIRVTVRDIDATVAAMQKLGADPGLRQKMGDAGRRKVLEQYTWKQTIEKIKSVYERVGGKR